MNRFLVPLVILCSALAGAGCSRAKSLCNDICDCEGCSDNEYEDCVDDAEDFERDADEEGCGAELDDLYACISAEQECDGDDWSFDGCSDEVEDLGRCCDRECGGLF